MTSSPIPVFHRPVYHTQAPASELVQRARELSDLGDWAIEPRGEGVQSVSISCEHDGLLLLLMLTPIQPPPEADRPQRWLLIVFACAVGTPFKIEVDRLLSHLGRSWLPLAFAIGYALNLALVLAFLRGLGPLWTSGLSLAGGAVLGAPLAVLLRRTEARRLERQRTHLLGQPSVKALLRLIDQVYSPAMVEGDGWWATP